MNDGRYYPNQTLVNLREIGGLPTADGRRMKTGLLFRSADLSRLSKKEQSILDRLHIRLICDLRSDKERQANPNRLPVPWTGQAVSIPIDANIQGLTRRQALSYLTGSFGDQEFEVFNHTMYHAIAFDHLTQVKAIFELISQASNLPALIHCTAGKDRTGFLAALIQLVVGVPRETVLEDYLLTNSYYEPQVQRYSRKIRWMTLFRAKPERIRQVFAAKPEFLEEVLDEMVQVYGTVEEYLERGCGVPASRLSELRKILLSH
jgi:protein-tyrosine phosphatase